MGVGVVGIMKGERGGKGRRLIIMKKQAFQDVV
jgi:hypothetical protein